MFGRFFYMPEKLLIAAVLCSALAYISGCRGLMEDTSLTRCGGHSCNSPQLAPAVPTPSPGTAGPGATPPKSPDTPSLPGAVPGQFFGMHIHHLFDGTPWPSAPIGALRLWDAGVSWRDLQPSRDAWDFTMLDQQLAAAKQHNSEVLLVLGLTPTWASSRPGENSNYGLGAIAPPANIEDWRNYVRTVGLRYKGQISAYEIWNEVNLSYYFSGTVSDMLMLAQEAYIILKQIDPAAVVTSPSAMGGGYVWLDQFLTAGGSAYCDVIAFHFYNFPAIPESMTWLINKVQSVMSNHGILNKPLWNTEIGWGYPQTFSSEEEMASYIARTVLINWSYHVSRIYWYAWDNHGWASLWLTEQDNTTLTKAGVAWNTVHSWLLGTQLNSCQYISDSVIGCNLNTSSGPAHIIWAPQGTIQFTAPSNWSIETIGTLDGNIQPFPAGPITVTRDPIFLK